MEIPVFIGVLLAATGGTSAACVLYTTQGNLKPITSRLFFGIGICIMLWSFGLAVQTIGAGASIRFLGSRIAPIGYSMMFSLLLHYVLVLCYGKRFLKRWWVYALIYLPGLISAYGLSIRPALRHLPDTMLHTRFGWVNISSNGWIHFYYFYYIFFFITIMLLLWGWSKRTDSEDEKKQARLLLRSMMAGIVLGSVTDVGLGLLAIRVPSIASIFSMLPLLAISYCVKRYGFMQEGQPHPDETILDRANRSRVYGIMGYCFIVGGLLNFLAQRLFYQETALPGQLLFSAILPLVGLAAILMRRMAVDEVFKEFLFAAILSMIIPLVTLRFAVYASITVWPFFVLLLMISLLFSQRILMLVILFAAVQTQLLVWSITPSAYVGLDSADHMGRIGLIALAAFVSLYINKIYRRRLRENAGYAYTQSLVSEISQSLVLANEENFNEKAVGILAQCGAMLQCDRAGFMLWDHEKRCVQRSCEWLAEGDILWNGPYAEDMDLCFPKIRACFPENKPLIFPDSAQLPEPLTQLRERLLQRGLRGALLVPIAKSGRDLGLMAFGASRTCRDWVENPPQFLSIISNTIADTVAKLEDIRQIEWAAYHDLLTMLPNRILFKLRLYDAVERAAAAGTMLGLAFVDLDSFKTINDTMGHEAGDLLLQEIAKTISGQIGPKDTLARFGGDEFVLLMEPVFCEEEVIERVYSILAALRRPVLLRGQEVYVTGSIGIALYPKDGKDAETLIKNADMTMYEAKKLGKNQYALCSHPLKERMEQNAQLTRLLYRALERDQLSVYYQPQIALETGKIVGVESLLRWNHPDYGFIGPATFIPLAEQTGLIQPIGAWVLETACRQNKLWQESGFAPVRMVVNISVRQLENRNFVRSVADILGRTGLAPAYLELEMSEGAINSGAVEAADVMARLKALGLSLSIGDFGTAYSSLERLRLLPIDKIKMDMQFVRGIESADKDKAIAQVIISLAKSLGMKVIAKGVETKGQLDFLSQKMCDEVQGFYYYQPMGAEAVAAMFQKSPQRRLEMRANRIPAGSGGALPL